MSTALARIGRSVHDATRMTPAPRMTLLHTLRSETMRFTRSPLALVHLVCAFTGGIACGAYFAYAPWDPAFGADAYVQLLGALMPLMASIVCGLNVDEERRAGRLANLTGAPSRATAIAAKAIVLWLAGAIALLLAVGIFAGALALAGRLALGLDALVFSVAGLALGSIPLYLLFLAVALRTGRNAAIGVGAAGLGIGLFSVGGLAHGLMTGELTAATGGILGLIPFAWPARLGSLAIEAGIAQMSDAAQAAAINSLALELTIAAAALTAAGLAALIAWFNRFEGGKDDA